MNAVSTLEEPKEPRFVFDQHGNAVNFDDLADIRDVVIDPALPLGEKHREFLRLIKNPHLYRYEDTVIHANFSNNGAMLADRLKQYFYSARGIAI